MNDDFFSVNGNLKKQIYVLLDKFKVFIMLFFLLISIPVQDNVTFEFSDLDLGLTQGETTLEVCPATFRPF